MKESIDEMKLARMKRRILELEKENVTRHSKSENDMKEMIRNIIIDEEKKIY